MIILTTEKLHITLTTTHLPLHDIANTITPTLLHEIITILHHNLQTKFNITEPHILIYKLNPHTNENNHINTKKINTIIPILNKLQTQKIKLNKPLPTDTLFQPKYLNNTDTILTIYHNQNLPILKYQNFKHNINITLNLPFIHTSINHNTTLKLTKHNKTDIDNFITTLNLAIKIIINTQ